MTEERAREGAEEKQISYPPGRFGMVACCPVGTL